MVGAQSLVKQEFLMKSLAGSGQGRICSEIRKMTLRFIKNGGKFADSTLIFGSKKIL